MEEGTQKLTNKMEAGKAPHSNFTSESMKGDKRKSLQKHFEVPHQIRALLED